jgi:hypothetical protein
MHYQSGFTRLTGFFRTEGINPRSSNQRFDAHRNRYLFAQSQFQAKSIIYVCISDFKSSPSFDWSRNLSAVMIWSSMALLCVQFTDTTAFPG